MGWRVSCARLKRCWFELTPYISGGPEDTYVRARARLRLKMFELALTQSYVELALPRRYKFPVGGVVAVVDNILSFYLPEYGYLDKSTKRRTGGSNDDKPHHTAVR